MSKLDYDRLKQLESLLDDGVIEQEEYDKKVLQMVQKKSNKEEPDSEKTDSSGSLHQENKEDKQNTKSNIIIVALIALALIASVLGYQLYTVSEELKDKDNRIESLQSEITSLRGYRSAVKDFYLDSAVMVIEGGGRVYHRYGCPEIPNTYSYWLYNVDAARESGYRECPTCFGDSADVFCKKHIEF